MVSGMSFRIPALPLAGLVACTAGVSLGYGQMAPTASVTDLKQLSIEQLMNTEVTSVSLYPEKLQQTASAVQVVTNADMVESGAETIPEALRLADNLDVAEKNPHDYAISARGFNSNVGDKLLVLIDGRTVYTPIFSGVFWSSQDYLLQDLDRIEVISGPGGSIYGANAVNGVINIISKSAAETQGAYLETGVGTDLQQMLGVRYGGTLTPDISYRAYVKYIGRGDDELSTGIYTPDSWSQTQAGFRIDAKSSVDNALTLQGDIYSGALNEAGVGLARLEGENLLGRWTHAGADGSNLSLQVYYDRTYLDEPFPASPFAGAGLLRDALATYDVQLQDELTSFVPSCICPTASPLIRPCAGWARLRTMMLVLRWSMSPVTSNSTRGWLGA